MVWLHFFLFSRVSLLWDPPSLLNGAAAPFFSLSMVLLHFSHVLESSLLLWRLPFCSSWFHSLLYGKSFLPCNADIPLIISIMLSKPPLVFFLKTSIIHPPARVSSSFLFKKILILLCIFPKNHHHSSIIYILLSCPESTLPKPMWSLSMSILCTPSHWLHLHGKTTHQPGEGQQSSACCWVTFPKIFSIIKDITFQLHFLQVSSCQIKITIKNPKKKARIHEVETIPIIQSQHSFH